MLNTVLDRLTALETSNAELREANAGLRERLMTVEKDNVELEVTLQTTMEESVLISAAACCFVLTFMIYRTELQSTKSAFEFCWSSVEIN
jgi:hypothetical protein